MSFPEIDRFLDSQGESINGVKRYRLVWSTDQLEIRKGTFNEFYGSVFLRQVSGVKLVPKYPFVQDRWILEKYFGPEFTQNDELPEAQRIGSYEPIFVFQDRNGDPLPVTLWATEFIVGFDRRGSKPDPCGDRALEQRAEDKEFNRLLDSIDTSPIQSLLHSREAIIRP